MIGASDSAQAFSWRSEVSRMAPIVVPSTRSGAPIADRMNPSLDRRRRTRFASRRLACAIEAGDDRFASRRLACAIEAESVVGHTSARSATKTAPPSPSPGASSYAGPPDPTPPDDRKAPGDFSSPSAGSLMSTIPVEVSGKISRQASSTADATEVTSRATPSLRPRVDVDMAAPGFGVQPVEAAIGAAGGEQLDACHGGDDHHE